jgi:hypothetical protein
MVRPDGEDAMVLPRLLTVLRDVIVALEDDEFCVLVREGGPVVEGCFGYTSLYRDGGRCGNM